jgi:hypothetical protein
VEAQGWITDENENIFLVAEVTKVTTRHYRLNHPSCNMHKGGFKA